MRIFNWITICLFLLFSSCEQRENTDNIIGNSTETIRLTDFVKAAKVTPLLEDTCFRIGEISKAVKYNNTYLVLDHQHKTIVKYDMEGKPTQKMNRIGKAKGEYFYIEDFCVDKECDDIILLCEPMKVIVLDSNFNFKDTYILDKWCERIYSYEGNLYVYSGMNRSLYILQDNKLKAIKEEGALPAMGFYPSPIFYETRNLLLYSAVGSDCIYSVTNKSVKPFFEFAYKNKQQVYKRLKKTKLISDWTIEEQQDYSPIKIINILETDNELIILYSYRLLIRCCRIERNTREILSDGILSTFSPLPTISSNGSVMASDFLYQGRQKMDSLLYCDVSLSFSSEEDFPTLIEYNLK